jgi:hypothetical protein
MKAVIKLLEVADQKLGRIYVYSCADGDARRNGENRDAARGLIQTAIAELKAPPPRKTR